MRRRGRGWGRWGLLVLWLLASHTLGLTQPADDYPLYLPAITLNHDLHPSLPLIHALYLPAVGVSRALRPPPLRLTALYYDTLVAGEPDESFELWNPGPDPLDLQGWTVSDGTRQSVFPSLVLSATQSLWCAYNAAAFQASFGVAPACEYGPPTDPAVPHLDGQPVRFTNTGGRLILHNPHGHSVDALVYKAGAATWGWLGPGLQPWHPTGIAEEGQIVYRKRDETTGQPLPDTDRAEDWANHAGDPLLGRKVRFPAWDTTAWRPFRADAPALVTVALTPDAGYDLVRAALASATTRLQLELYSFDHPALADLLAERGQAGVVTTVLLEGAPSGGLQDADRYAASRVAQTGGQVLYMTNAAGGRPRFRSQHAKFGVLDGHTLLLSSENLTPEALPADDKGDGTLGRRGVVLLTDQPALVEYASRLFARDTDRRWRDLVAWNPFDTVFGPPPPGYVPVYDTGGGEYAVQAPTALTAWADQFELLQSPENSLRQSDGLIGLLARAGAGDLVLTEQLTEQTWWGPSTSNPAQDPNPRLDAYLAAARRGATVRLLLDSFFDDEGEPRANRATCVYVNDLAVREGLDIQCRTANPTGLGIHNKMALVRLGGEGWVHVGSLNGSETSHKINRELALQFHSPPIYDYLARTWQWDWDNGR